MPLWQAAVLGIVQGVTEFLPISSTAHLLLVQEFLFGMDRAAMKKDPFTVVVQLGTLVAVLIYFRRDVLHMTKSFIADLRKGYFIRSQTPESRLAKLIIVGTIPAGVAGLTLKKLLEEKFYNPTAIAIVAIVFAVLMFIAERVARRRQTPRTEDSITVWDALFIGVFQAFALMPGGSRSGCTLTAGLFAGLARPAAARFSFLLSIPVMVAAGIKSILDWRKDIKIDPTLAAKADDQMMALVVGTLVSAVVGYLAIAWLLGFLRKYSMDVFVIYRIILGIAIVLLM